MQNSELKTRIAPSPTGNWHLGTARTALFTYLLARNEGGKFYLRIEDTDQNRLVEGAEERILETLQWLGLDLDDFPDGKPYHKQSSSLDRYKEVAEQLVEAGKAYYCFAKPEELDTMRSEQQAKKLAPRYDNRWGYRDLPLEEAKKRVAAGEPYVIRQKMRHDGVTIVHDTVHGEITVENATLDDHVLLKADGFPTYHLAHVVDDHDSGITHVIRGAEWLPSAPKHVQLHELLGWEVPIYVHVPVILGPDKGKLSKRHGAKSVLEYRDDGYLPEGILNFLLLLGWSSGTEQEIFTKDEMIKAFDFSNIHPSPAKFDAVRLDWFNASHIRQLPVQDLKNRVLNYWHEREPKWSERAQADPVKFDAIIAILHDRLTNFKEFPELVEFFYTAPTDYSVELLSTKKQTPDETKQALQVAKDVLTNQEDWSHDALEHTLRQAADQNNLKSGDLLWPIRSALTGLPASPSTFDVLSILGKEESLKRIDYAISKLA